VVLTLIMPPKKRTRPAPPVVSSSSEEDSSEYETAGDTEDADEDGNGDDTPSFSPAGRSGTADSAPSTPSRAARNPTGITSVAGLRRSMLRRKQKTTRPLRPEAYLRHAVWCMHCFRTFLDHWDGSEPPVIPCLDDGLASKKCRQCASRNKNCEPVSDVY
jgi:hypothetical protein